MQYKMISTLPEENLNLETKHDDVVYKSEKIHALVKQLKSGSLSKSELLRELARLQGSKEGSIEEKSPEFPSLSPIWTRKTLSHNIAQTDSKMEVKRKNRNEGRRQAQHGLNQSSAAERRTLLENVIAPCSPMSQPCNTSENMRNETADYSSEGSSQSYDFFDDLRLEVSWNSVNHNLTGKQIKSIGSAKSGTDTKERPSPKPYKPEVQKNRRERKTYDKSLPDRLQKWALQKEEERTYKLKARQKNELKGCTFSPKINRRKGDGSVSAESHKTAYNRLYEHSKNRVLKSKEAAKARKQAEVDRLKECTFKPKLQAKRRASVSSRYQNPEARKENKDKDKGADFRECSFSPKVMDVNKKMTAAKRYTSTNIFDRLAQNKFESFLQKEKKEIAPSSNVSKTKLKRRSSLPNPGQTNPDKGFQSFLERQNKHARMKKLNKKKIEAEIKTSFSPKLCKKSLKIANRKSQDTFLDRVAKERQLKQLSKERNLESNKDPECTFTPKITKIARRKHPRSVIEMSLGDSLKKQERIRTMKKKVDKEELKKLTFKPKTRKGNQNVEGCLRLLSEPETYLQRIRETHLCLNEKQKEAVRMKEAKELEECTFTPTITTLPKYLKSHTECATEREEKLQSK